MCFVLFLFIWLGFGFGFVCLFAKFNAPLKLHTVALSNFLSLALSCFFFCSSFFFVQLVQSILLLFPSAGQTGVCEMTDSLLLYLLFGVLQSYSYSYTERLFSHKELCGLLGSITFLSVVLL